MKAILIPDSVLYMAERLKEAHRAGQQLVAVRPRRAGVTAAHNLAFNTEDAEYEQTDQPPAGTSDNGATLQG